MVKTVLNLDSITYLHYVLFSDMTFELCFERKMPLKIGTQHLNYIGSTDYSDMISSFVIFITL